MSRNRKSLHEVFQINPRLAPTINENWETAGLRLAETSEKEGGWKEWFRNTRDIDEVCGLPGSRLRPEHVVAQCAMLLENAKFWALNMNEAQRAITVGGFVDHLFPTIRAGFTQNPILNMVSVQPMTKAIGQIFFMNYVYGSTKGSIQKGTSVFDVFTGYAGGYEYSSEQVRGEQIANSGATSVGPYTLVYGAGSENGGGGVRPGSFYATWTGSDGVSTMVVRDNGNGALVKDTVSSTSNDSISGTLTINYATGVVNIGTVTAGTSAILATYAYDAEGAANVPTVQVRISSSAVTAKTRKLRYDYSFESAQDMAAETGMNIDSEIAQGCAGLLATEQARDVLADLWAMAGVPFASFSTTVPGGGTPAFTRREYYPDVQLPLAQASNVIFTETRKATANWMIVDVPFLNLLEQIGAPHFAGWKQAPRDDNQIGIKFAGTWGDRIQVWVDPQLQDFAGASPIGNALLGYKGSDFQDAGYVWAPYQLLYKTNPLTPASMLTEVGLASRVGKKGINHRFYRRVELTN